jgi:hypothetical protein
MAVRPPRQCLEGKPGTQSGKSWSDWQQVYVPMLRRDFPQAALEGVE